MNAKQKLELLKLYHRDPKKFRKVVKAMAVKTALEEKEEDRKGKTLSAS